MSALRYGFSLALITLVVNVPGGWAQQQTQEPQSQQEQNQTNQPIPAYHSPLASAADNGVQDTSDADQLAPDTRLPAGAQNLSLGAPKTGHGYWAPYLYASSSSYSNPDASGNGTDWTTFASLSGGLDLREISHNSDLTLTYLGGGSISSDGTDNSITQQLGLAERITFHRSVIAFIDQFDYLPQAGFGYNGLGTNGLGTGTLSTSGNIGLQTGLTQVQSILTPAGQRVDNSSVGEFDRFLTRRSSLSFVGSYGLSYYLDNNLANSKEMIFQAGYNYQLSRKSTIAVSYNFEGFRYSNIGQSINDHSVLASYSRRVVGRLAFQVSAGPQFIISQAPISASGSSVTTGNTTQLSWTANAQLNYQLRRTQFLATYGHGVTAGSGVLAGSVTDIVSGLATRQLSRHLSAGWTIGYSRNTGQGVTTSVSVSPAQGFNYNYFFSGVNLTRTWGRSMNVFAGYQIQYQNTSSVPCILAPCNTSFVNHQIYAGLGWNPRRFIR